MGLRTVTLRPGEKVILPKGVKLESIITDGSISVTSTCPLPEPTTYKCGHFTYVVDDDDNTGHPMDETLLKISKLYVGDNIYTIDLFGYGTDFTGLHPTVDELNSRIPDPVLFQFTHVKISGDYTKRKYMTIYFKTPENLFASSRLSIDERGNGAVMFYLVPGEHICGDYSLSL